MMLRLPVIALLMAGSAAVVCGASCEGLAKTSLPHTAIRLAEVVPAGSFQPPAGQPIPNLPSFCRVAGVIQPSSDSKIQFEVWMPAAGWNGKFLGIGNGGYAGAIGFGGMGVAISGGYATASTDTGHAATSGIDASWALDHPEKIADFGYRAIHETAEKAKALIREFYGDGPKRSYFNSCSNGGRQALMEAQRFPEDYDGIVAGAPANFWTHLMAAAAWEMQGMLSDPASYIPESKLPAIQAAAIAACDTLDGAKDSTIEDPSRCKFDPAKLLCSGAESDSCLTAPQVAALRRLYDGPKDAKGRRVFPGYAMGGEAEQGGWGPWISGPEREKSAMFLFSTQFFKNMVYTDPSWDFRKMDFDRDIKAAVDRAAKYLNSNDPDLRKFHARGGKLILYHGWSDAAIPGQNAVDYYESVLAKVGKKKASEFVRLFMVPGMQHCGGGSGANSFGQMTTGKGDPSRDVGAAIERWVEQGVAPDQILATRYKTGANPASGVVKTHPLCAYPQVAIYKGSGSVDDAANFRCGVAGK